MAFEQQVPFQTVRGHLQEILWHDLYSKSVSASSRRNAPKKKKNAAFASAHNCGSNALQHNLEAKQNFANRYLHWESAGETDLTLVLFRN